MLCRLHLAALHYNENANRGQATTSTGDPLYKRSFPKFRKGECRARPVKTDATFMYCTGYLMDMIMEKVFVDPSSYADEILKINIPPDLSSQYEHPDKEEVIASYVSSIQSRGGSLKPYISSMGVRKLPSRHMRGSLPVSFYQGSLSTSSQNFCRLNTCND
ncbi:hypothetical protein AALO_G00166280 [Alosa alosa]|uniref:Uncharacterized protein n=1 Tax=Alosa alosa TaxID=278164 RepID=A0AAV6GF57_9TELE|nr:hypothetical protein AALO_G00166280 [Alosa alosa]